MSEETMRLSGQIAAGLYEYMFNHPGPWRISGQEYDIADDQQYADLGEDVTRTDLPLVLVRRSDKKMFEIEIDVTVTETSPELRQQDRERFRLLREQAQARKRKQP